MCVHDFGTCKENAAAQCQLPTNSAAKHKHTFLNRKSALRGRILFASIEVMHTPRSNFSLHIDIKNIHQIRAEQ